MNITKRDVEIAGKIGRSPFITSWAIDYIETRLPDYEGANGHGADFGYTLTEKPNIDGAYIIGYRDAWAFISCNINDARDEYDYQVSEFGKPCCNPFEDPEGFVCNMLINVVNDIIGMVPKVLENWNNCFELTKDDIKEILDFLGRGDNPSESVEE